ncbi:hypothetical protein PM8797T_21128 [Gimesia maris DSM 8797]|nr:hypothetical protein PM8797T_21128 [Gimesia maris DSM 8797]
MGSWGTIRSKRLLWTSWLLRAPYSKEDMFP